jgi:predicted kinase
VERLIIVIFGLMGVGKTTLARHLGASRGWPVIHSDAVRKTLAGMPPTTPVRLEFGKGIYQEEFSQRTYEEMRRQARELLRGGAPVVVLDASFKSAAERRAIRKVAKEEGALAVFVLCQCPREVVRTRLSARAANLTSISDGRLELLDRQIEDFEPLSGSDQPLLLLDTSGTEDESLLKLNAFLERWLGASNGKAEG